MRKREITGVASYATALIVIAIIDDARKLPFSYIPAALHASDVGADARLTVHFVWRNDGRFVVSITPSASSGTK